MGDSLLLFKQHDVNQGTVGLLENEQVFLDDIALFVDVFKGLLEDAAKVCKEFGEFDVKLEEERDIVEMLISSHLVDYVCEGNAVELDILSLELSHNYNNYYLTCC